VLIVFHHSIDLFSGSVEQCRLNHFQPYLQLLLVKNQIVEQSSCLELSRIYSQYLFRTCNFLFKDILYHGDEFKSNESLIIGQLALLVAETCQCNILQLSVASTWSEPVVGGWRTNYRLRYSGLFHPFNKLNISL